MAVMCSRRPPSAVPQPAGGCYLTGGPRGTMTVLSTSKKRAVDIMPPPSVSKAGCMSEITTSTRQLAKAGMQTLQKKPKAKATFYLPVALTLEEFGTGTSYDTGQRNKEMLSSPRADLLTEGRIEADAKSSKTRGFYKTMDLRYDATGVPLELDNADPIDQKYQRFCIRRPLSSRMRAAEKKQLQEGGSEAGSEEDPEVQEARMLAALEEMYTGEDEHSSTQKLSTFFQNKIPRDPPESTNIYNSKPCIGQYDPKYTIVHRTPCRPPDWEREGHRSTTRVRPSSAPAGAPRPPATPSEVPELNETSASQAATAANLAQTLDMMNTMNVGEAAAADAKDDGEKVPSDFHKWVDRTRGGRAAQSVRPSSAFTTTPRKPLMTSTTPSPGAYWPYNCNMKRYDHHLRMKKGQGREAKTGFLASSSKTPDVVYDIPNTDHVPSVAIHLQPPRKPLATTELSNAHARVYDLQDEVLSTTKAVHAPDFSKGQGHAKVGPRPDTRKALTVNYESVTPTPSVGVDIAKQTLRPNVRTLTSDLDYTPQYDAVDKHSRKVDMNWGGGHQDVFATSPTAALNYNPSDTAVRRRDSRGPNMARSTSRKKNFGAFVPVRMLDCVYDWQPTQSHKSFGARFEKQVGRDRRERALKQKLTRADNFYDIPAPKVPNIIPFEKHLARSKRGPTKLRTC